jgi:hypothetical protein
VVPTPILLYNTIIIKERDSSRFLRSESIEGLVQPAPYGLLYLTIAMGLFIATLDGTGEFAYYVV